MTPGRNCSQCTRKEILYLVGSISGLLTGLGFAVYGIITDRFRSEDSSFLFVFAVNCCFALIYTVKGVKHEDPYDLMILVLSVAPIVLYVTIDYSSNRQTDFKEVRLILCLMFSLFIGSFGIYFLVQYLKSKNFITNYGTSFVPPSRSDALGNSNFNAAQKNYDNLKGYLRTMLLFYFLLSVNLQCDLSAAVFTLTSGYAIQLKSGFFIHKDMFILFFAVMIIAACAFIFGHISIKYESKLCVFFFGMSSVFLVATGMYLLVQAAEDINKTEVDHKLSVITLFTAILMVFLRIITCTGCYLAYNNFGKGLKQAVYGGNHSEQSGLIERDWNNPLYTSTDVQNSYSS